MVKKPAGSSLKKCPDSSSTEIILKVPEVRDPRGIISNLSVAALNEKWLGVVFFK